ncbi:MAG: hypothetical protein KDI13_03185 [Alphaproteobacteria bacterium]|nr:hypothetical protein [Alphaproteobacteria bacterium]
MLEQKKTPEAGGPKGSENYMRGECSNAKRKRQDNLISFWLHQCNARTQAYDLLENYQYCHNWIAHGDLGGIYARITGRYFELDEDGDFFVAQAVWYDPPSLHNPVEEPLLIDVIAWHPQKPKQWYFYRGEPGLILGERALFDARIFQESLTLHSTPFNWLRAGCKGCVLLDQHGLNHLYGLKDVVCEDIAHGTRIEEGLSLYYLKNMPRLSVPAHGGRV